MIGCQEAEMLIQRACQGRVRAPRGLLSTHVRRGYPAGLPGTGPMFIDLHCGSYGADFFLGSPVRRGWGGARVELPCHEEAARHST